MRRMFLVSIWIAIDVVLFCGAYVLAYFLRVGFINSTDFPLDRFVSTVFLIAPLWIGVMISLRIFTLTRVQASLRNFLHILFACAMGVAFFTIAYYFLYLSLFSRMLLVLTGVFSLAAATVWHLAFDQWQRKILRRDPPAYPTLIIGANRDAERMIGLLNLRQSFLKPVAVLDSAGASVTDIAGVPVMGKLNKLEDVIKEHRITHVIQCANLEHTLNLLSACRHHRITYMLMPTVLGIVEGDERVELIEGQQPIIVVD